MGVIELIKKAHIATTTQRKIQRKKWNSEKNRFFILLTVRMQNPGFREYIYRAGCKYHRLHRIAQKHDANHLELFDK